MKNLLYICIKNLGLKNGVKYWRLCKRAEKDPDFVLDWAERCESAAEQTKNEEEKKMLKNWARTLRVCHEDYLNKK